MTRAPQLLLVLLVVAGALSCRRAERPPDDETAVFQRGIASWYGPRFHGRRTANGEVFDMNQATAAHRTLPFNTRLKVIEGSGKSVDVRVNDRGPYTAGRILDLSRQSADDLGILSKGTAPVQLVVISRPRTRAPEQFAVQVAMVADRDEAETLRERYQGGFGTARVVLHDEVPPLWRVLVGAEPSLEQAEQLRNRIGSRDGLSFVVLLDQP